MTPEAAGRIAGLGGLVDRNEVRKRLRDARALGATVGECEEALRLWDEMNAASVQVVESQPSRPRCRCSHKPHGGLCGNPVCGCGSYRPQPSSPPPTTRARPLHLDIEEANRRDARDAGELASPPASYDQTRRSIQ